MLHYATFSGFLERRISVASHYAEAGFVNTTDRIGDVRCKRNYHSSNTLRQFFACSMLRENLRFCSRPRVPWAF